MSERQYGTIEEIRIDHRTRYEFARDLIDKDDIIIDAACGCGYGSFMLSQKAFRVYGVDVSEEAIKYAKKHYRGANIFYWQRMLPCKLAQADFVISFETIEHVEEPLDMLKSFRKSSNKLICSVPNEEIMPFVAERFPFHHRHYTKIELNELLEQAGWKVTEWHGQVNAYSRVEPDIMGRTLVAVCE